MAPLIVLAGLEWGGQALGLCVSILNKLFPNCVSIVPDVTLSEAELRGLEGPAPGKGPFRWSAVFQKQCGSTMFFFFDTLGLALIFGLLIIRL